MRRMLILASGLAGVCAGLAACATPSYPISESNGASPAAQIKIAQVSPPTVTSTPTSVPPVVTDQAAAPAAAAVESRPLPPASAPSSTSAPAAAMPLPVTSAQAPARVEGRLVASGKVVKATRMYRDYVVQKGDHLFAVARDFQTTADELVDANDLKSANVLRPGQHLKIPIEKAYVAEPGDTLGFVAQRFGVSAQNLSDLNDLPVRARLRSGDRIALPAQFEDHGPIRLSPELIEARSRPSRSPRLSSGVFAPGPYVPSESAVEAGARHRVEEQAGSSEPPPSPYRPTTGIAAASTPPPADVIAAGQGRFIWPVKGDVISGFGIKDLGRKNDGIDVKASQGTAVHAAAAGEVVYSGDQVPGFGNLVLIKHADGWVSAYAHLDRSLVHMRQSVMQGDEIGEVGLSGGVTEPQLHFELSLIHI